MLQVQSCRKCVHYRVCQYTSLYTNYVKMLKNVKDINKSKVITTTAVCLKFSCDANYNVSSSQGGIADENTK